MVDLFGLFSIFKMLSSWESQLKSIRQQHCYFITITSAKDAKALFFMPRKAHSNSSTFQHYDNDISCVGRIGNE